MTDENTENDRLNFGKINSGGASCSLSLRHIVDSILLLYRPSVEELNLI